jgi:hypothetical protein
MIRDRYLLYVSSNTGDFFIGASLKKHKRLQVRWI